MANPSITPRTLRGFRDFLPAAMMQREQVMDTARRVYRSYGFAPIDTPVLEYLEILTGKGSEETDRLMYQFEDNGGRKVGMRFDLTVPLARYCAQHWGELGAPFKRYHIAPVWRGENTHRGRYREFVQCDFDTIGTRSLLADVEVAQVIDDLLTSIGIERFRIRVNNRRVLNGLLDRLGLVDRSTDVLRALDKLTKVGRDEVVAEMIDKAGATAEQAERILAMAAAEGTHDEILERLVATADGHAPMLEGIEQLRTVVQGAIAAGVPANRIEIDPSIARGLDYYTGTIYETFLDDLPDIGSVCSGGRYDDLAGTYTKEQLPGIGASLGLDRLLAAMEILGMASTRRTPSDVLVALFDPKHETDYLVIASRLRRAGLNAEVYPEPRKLGQQLKFADRQGFPFVLIIGSREFAESRCQLKRLDTGKALELPLEDDAAAIVRAIRDSGSPGDPETS